MKLGPAAWLVMACLGLGCRSGGTASSGESFATIGDLKPTAPIPTQANLKIGQIDMPVEIRQQQSGSTMTLELLAHGQVLETETYRVQESSFDLVSAAGEKYSEPLSLLKFPFRVGDSWNWVGTMSAGEAPHKATAAITTTSETVLMPTAGATPAILVVVDLSISGGGPTPAKRKMRFWFSEGKGLIRRQFGDASSREPAAK